MPLDPTPVPTGLELHVDASTAQFQFNPVNPAAAALAGGGFVVARHTFDPQAGSAKASYFGSDVYAQLHAADGTPAGDEVRVHNVLGGSQDDPVITALADGGFVVAWMGFGPPGIGGHGIYIRRFGSDGAPVGDEVRADVASDDFRGSPEITALAGGGFVVAWVQTDPSGAGGADVYARRFGADGAPAGEGFRVHASAASSQGSPKIVALADGGFVVTWDSDAEPDIFTDLDASDVYARRFTPDGVPVGGEFRVHDATDGYQDNLGAWVLPDGRFAVTWRGPDPSAANGHGLYVRFFEAPGFSGPPAMPSKAEVVARVVSQAEGDAGVTAFTFDVTLGAAPSTPQSVRWQVEGCGSRPADAADFEGGVLPSGVLAFAAGETRKTVTVRVAGDTVLEADETFAVSLRAPSEGLVIGAVGHATATILDDDLPASAPPGHAAKVARLYDAALDRLPDREGFEFWVGALQQGEALSSLASGFLSSPEFAARFGDASANDGAFVDRLYQNVLGRAGEAEGRAFWGDSLDKGCTRAEVLAAFSESAEHVALTAAALRAESGVLFA